MMEIKLDAVNIVKIWTFALWSRRLKRSDVQFDRWLAPRFLHIDAANVPQYLAEHETAEIVAQMLAARQYG